MGQRFMVYTWRSGSGEELGVIGHLTDGTYDLRDTASEGLHEELLS